MDLGGGPGSGPPFWRRIYYMTLRFYCKKVLYLVSKHTKRYLKGKNIQKIRLRKVYYTVPTNYHPYIKGKIFSAPPFENFCIRRWEVLSFKVLITWSYDFQFIKDGLNYIMLSGAVFQNKVNSRCIREYHSFFHLF